MNAIRTHCAIAGVALLGAVVACGSLESTDEVGVGVQEQAGPLPDTASTSASGASDSKKPAEGSIPLLQGRLKLGRRYVRWKSDSEGSVLSFVCEDSGLLTGPSIAVWRMDSYRQVDLAHWRQGVQDGLRCWGVNGHISCIGRMSKGERCGGWIIADGTAPFSGSGSTSVCGYVNGKLHGKYAVYRDDGAVAVSGEYERGQPTGYWRGESPSRDLRWEGLIGPKGEPSGEWKYERLDGTLVAKISFGFGRLHGIYELYFPSGALSLSGEFDRARRSGSWRSYYENGSLHWSVAFDGKNAPLFRGSLMTSQIGSTLLDVIEPEILDKDDLRGSMQGELLWYSESGVMLARVQFDNGQESGLCQWWHADGQPEEEAVYARGARSGLWRRWNERGVLIWRADLKDGEGPADSFDDNGKPNGRGRADANGRTGQWQMLDEAGEIVATGEFVEDNRYGPWDEYCADGTVWRGRYGTEGTKVGLWQLFKDPDPKPIREERFPDDPNEETESDASEAEGG